MFSSNVFLRLVYICSFLHCTIVFTADSSELEKCGPISLDKQKEEILADLHRKSDRKLKERYDIALVSAPPGVQKVIRALEDPKERKSYG